MHDSTTFIYIFNHIICHRVIVEGCCFNKDSTSTLVSATNTILGYNHVETCTYNHISTATINVLLSVVRIVFLECIIWHFGFGYGIRICGIVVKLITV